MVIGNGNGNCNCNWRRRDFALQPGSTCFLTNWSPLSLVMLMVIVVVMVMVMVTMMVLVKVSGRLKELCLCPAARFHLLLNEIGQNFIKLALNQNDHQVELLCQRGSKLAASKVGF